MKHLAEEIGAKSALIDSLRERPDALSQQAAETLEYLACAVIGLYCNATAPTNDTDAAKTLRYLLILSGLQNVIKTRCLPVFGDVYNRVEMLAEAVEVLNDPRVSDKLRELARAAK